MKNRSGRAVSPTSRPANRCMENPRTLAGVFRSRPVSRIHVSTGDPHSHRARVETKPDQSSLRVPFHLSTRRYPETATAMRRRRRPRREDSDQEEDPGDSCSQSCRDVRSSSTSTRSTANGATIANHFRRPRLTTSVPRVGDPDFQRPSCVSPSVLSRSVIPRSPPASGTATDRWCGNAARVRGPDYDPGDQRGRAPILTES